MFYQKIIFLFCLIMSLQAIADFSELEHRWLSVESILLSDQVKQGEPIRSPQGTYIVLAELSLLNQKFQSVTDCLIYRVPAKNQKGELKAVSLRPGERCEDHLLTLDSFWKSTKIYNLAISVTKDELLLNIDTKEIKFVFFNKKREKKRDLLETSAYPSKVAGVFISTFSNSYGQSLKAGQVCFDTYDSCQVQLDRCHLCEKGSYPVIAGSCQANLRRYCGQKECGSKDHPACIRGIKASGYLGPYCINDSPIAYCQKPFRVVCVNEELLCR